MLETLSVPGNWTKRYWSKVLRLSADECWPWLNRLDRYGYGAFKLNGKPRKAHRVAWELVHGVIPAGLFVCHTCDKPACVNPTHLFLGNNKDNMVDRDLKGRTPKGDLHPLAKLKSVQVVAVVADLQGGGTVTSIAQKNRVGVHVVSDIKNGRTWTHLTGIKHRAG